MGADVVVVDNAGERRFEAFVEGSFAGSCAYVLEGRVLTLPHTKVEAAFEGRGVGAALARFALGHARDGGFSVVPACSFIAAFIERHSEYSGLVG